MSQPGPKLRVGLLLGSTEAAAWVARMLERIHASDYAQIVLLVVDQSPPVPGVALLTRLRRAPRQTLQGIVRRGLDAFNQRWLEAKSNLPSAFARLDLMPLLGGLPRVDVVPTRTLWSDRFSDAEIAAIRTHDVDVLLRIGFRILRGDILTVARHGVWSFHHGDNQVNRGGPPGFWEAMQAWPEIGCTLQVLSEDLDNGVVLARTWSATVPESVAESNDSTYWKSLSLVPRQLQQLHHKGAERFFAEARAAEPHPQLYSRRLYRAADNTEFAGLLLRKSWRKLQNRLRHQLWFDQWIILIHMANGFSSSLWRYQRLLPPKDRFWADPFVLQRGGRYFVFIEELMYATGKGHIAVIEVDAKGKAGPAKEVLVTDHHLSYPFVFEHEGQTYMVPESRSAGCITLYRCVEFPLRWEKVMNLMDDVAAVDTTLHYHQGRWWLFANMVENRGGSSFDELYVFHAETFATQAWTPHPLNPVVSDVRSARPAGRLFERDGRLYRPSQDCSHRYGWGFNINVVDVLDPSSYVERVVSKAQPDWAPDVLATHTYNAAGRLNVIDAQIRRRR